MREDHEKRSSMKDHKRSWRRIINENHDGEPRKKDQTKDYKKIRGKDCEGR